MDERKSVRGGARKLNKQSGNIWLERSRPRKKAALVPGIALGEVGYFVDASGRGRETRLAMEPGRRSCSFENADNSGEERCGDAAGTELKILDKLQVLHSFAVWPALDARFGLAPSRFSKPKCSSTSNCRILGARATTTPKSNNDVVSSCPSTAAQSGEWIAEYKMPISIVSKNSATPGL